MELLAPAPPAERAPDAARFEQELGRESERLSRSADEPVDDVAPVAEREAEAAIEDPAGIEAEAAIEDESLPDDEDAASSDGDDELAALEQLLLVVAGAPAPQSPPIAPIAPIAPSGGEATVAVEGAVAASVTSVTSATSATPPPVAAAPVANGAKNGSPNGATTDGSVAGELPEAAAGETAADSAPVAATGDGATKEGGLLEGGVADSTKDLAAIDASALPETTTAAHEAALAERLARELADARPIVATSALAATTATTASSEVGAPASVARATATLAQLPALLDDAVVRLQRHEGRWEAEIRLDPPELGVVQVRLELDGGHLRVVARCDDRSVEQQLGQLFKEWDENLRKQGGEASFDLDRRAKEERDATQARGERSLPAARAARSGGGVGPGAGLRVDLLA